MTIRRIIPTVAGLVLLGQALLAAELKPNLVVFLSDDHSYADTSIAGSAQFPTPHLERIAKAGMTFREAFAPSPSCAPCRAALLTGLMPLRNGAMLNHQPPRASIKKLPAYLQELGYEVVAFGKVAHYKQGKDYGFDRVAHDTFHDHECIPAALDFLEERTSQRPLCLMVGTNWPHVPWPEAPEGVDLARFDPPPTHVDTRATRRWRARYAAAVGAYDRDLGLVYDAAYAKLGKNTLFLHFSDHGAQWPFGKWNLYDAGTRVPLVAVWPSVVQPGRASDAMINLVDVLPTLIECAGGAAPQELDGRSFARVLSGEQNEHRQRVFTTHSGDGRMNAYPMRSVRTRAWKYIRNLAPETRHATHIDQGKAVDGSDYWSSWVEEAKTNDRAAEIVARYRRRPAEELYDLDSDPHEQHNLAADPAHAQTLARMSGALDEWMRAQGDEGLTSEREAWAEFKATQAATRRAENAEKKAARARPNVLFIAVDDLRPLAACYGHEEMVTPSIDRLARSGRRFDHHYVQVPTCGASRCALLTGQYPGAPRAYENVAFAELPRDDAAHIVSMPEHFRNNGYKTVSIGKITHSPDGHRSDGELELPFAWDEATVPHGEWDDAWSAFFAYANGKTRVRFETPVSERADVSDDGYPDGLIAEAAIEKLRKLKDQPFFLAVGFFKPHLPFNAPSRYWELYEADQLPAPSVTSPPANVDPTISLHNAAEMRQYTGFSPSITEADAKHLRHAYRACVSYTDAQIGRVLDELARLGLEDNTIVVLWGDHGWHLGELGVWGKHTLHEVALRSPLIIRVPGMNAPGEATNGLVESVDIYPTLAELCGLARPEEVSGQSVAELVRTPSAAGKPAAYGFWRGGRGHTIRTERYRLVLWTKARDPAQIVQTELYDLEQDPHESQNVADEFPEVVRELSRQLRATVPLLKAG